MEACFSHTEGGGGGVAHSFHSFIRGGGAGKVLPCLEGGGGHNKFRTHFVAPSP